MKNTIAYRSSRRVILGTLFVASIANLSAAISPAHAQEPKKKIRIANSAMSVTSLPLIAARDWKIFHEQGRGNYSHVARRLPCPR